MSCYGKRLPTENDVNMVRVLKQYYRHFLLEKSIIASDTRHGMSEKDATATNYRIVGKIGVLFGAHLLSLTCRLQLFNAWAALSDG